MFECDECLGGYYLCCFDLLLEEVLEGDWMCLVCLVVVRGDNVSLFNFFVLYSVDLWLKLFLCLGC